MADIPANRRHGDELDVVVRVKDEVSDAADDPGAVPVTRGRADLRHASDVQAFVVSVGLRQGYGLCRYGGTVVYD